MVDNRSAGFYGIGGSFNFKSGDISGTAAKTQDDKMGQGNEYFAQVADEEGLNNQQDDGYMDRSAILRATLNSLAMMNVANVINSKKQQQINLSEADRKKLLSRKRNYQNEEFIEDRNIEEEIENELF